MPAVVAVIRAAMMDRLVMHYPVTAIITMLKWTGGSSCRRNFGNAESNYCYYGCEKYF